MINNAPFSHNYKLTVINLLGGPGVGKSVTAAELFASMKKQGYKVELIHEIAKDFTWEQWHSILSEQDYVFAHQHRLQRRLVSHDIDYVIIDSSLILGLFYMPDDYPQSFKQFVLDVYNSYTNINVYLERSSHFPYDPVGRNQTEQEAIEIDKKVREFVQTLPTPLLVTESGDSACGEVLAFVSKQRSVLPC